MRRKRAQKQVHGERVAVREFRTNLAYYVDLANRGQAVTIIKNNRPVARLMPPPEKELDLWQDLIQAGSLMPAKRRDRKLPPKLKIKSAAAVVDTLYRNRDEERY